MAIDVPYLTIVIEDGTYAIDIANVREILDVREITRLPNSPMNLLGMIDLRGASVPVADMRMMMGYGMAHDDLHTRFVVVEVIGKLIGLRCDKVREVIRIDEGSFAPVDLGQLMHWSEKAVLGTARHNGKPVTLIDIAALFGAMPDLSMLAAE